MKDPTVERWLRETQKVSWEYREGVPLDDIDAEQSLKNQARLSKPLLPELVEQYVIAARGGAEFPALVGFQRQDGRIQLLGGNHRLAAFRRVKRKTTDIYVVRTAEPPLLAMIARGLNLLVGQRQDADTNMEHAVHAVLEMGHTLKGAASLFGIPKTRLEYELRLRQVQRRLSQEGIDARGISRGVQEALSSVRNNVVLAALARVAVEVRLSQEEARVIVTQVNQEHRSEASMLAIVTALRERAEMAARASLAAQNPRAQRVRAQVLRMVVGLQNLVARHSTVAACGLSLSDCATLAAAYDAVRPFLEEITRYGASRAADTTNGRTSDELPGVDGGGGIQPVA